MLNSGDDTLRYIVLGLNLVCLVAWIWLVKIHPPLWPSVMLPVILFVHRIVFYAVAIDRAIVTADDLIIWANGIDIQACLTWLIGGLLMGRVLMRAKNAK